VTHLSAAYTVYVALLHTLIEGKVKYVTGIVGEKRPGYHCGSIPGTASSSVGPEVEPRVVPWTPVDDSFGMIGNRRWIERRERLFRYLPLEPKAKRGSHDTIAALLAADFRMSNVIASGNRSKRSLLWYHIKEDPAI